MYVCIYIYIYLHTCWGRAGQLTPVFLAQESSWTEEPGGSQSIGSQSRTQLSTQYQPFRDFLGGSDGKASSCNGGDLGSIPGLGRSPGEQFVANIDSFKKKEEQ